MGSHLLQILLTYPILVESYIPPKFLVGIIDQLKFAEFVIHHKCFTFSEKAELLKIYSNRESMINLNQNSISHKHQAFITCTNNLIDINQNKQTNAPVLVISKIQNEMDLNEIKISVGDEVYFLDKNNFKIYEAYEINQIHIIRYLGQFHHVEKNSILFSPANDFVDSIVERRTNFHGLQLIGMVEYEPPYIDFPNNLLKKSIYFSENDTYDLTNIASGVYIDVLSHLQNLLNFSTKLYKRKDGVWGMPKTLKNGTIILNGLLQSIVNGQADILSTSFSEIPDRIPFVDYLPPLSQSYAALYISNFDYEIVDWTVYLVPFSIRLWLVICSSAISFMIIIKLIEMQHLMSESKLVSHVHMLRNISDLITLLISYNYGHCSCTYME